VVSQDKERRKRQMSKIGSWRGFDLTRRYKKIENALALKELSSADDFPIIASTPCYFAFGTPKPMDYCTNPAAMVKYQEEGFYHHLSMIHDDVIPYFMPSFGTDVMATAFGCRWKMPESPTEDPEAFGDCIKAVGDILKLKVPDFESAGLMPMVLKAIDFAAKNSDLPVGLCDGNSPLSTAAKMCGHERFFVWLYEEPQAVRDLLHLVCQSFTQWVKVQKEHTGEGRDESNGLMGVWAPKGLGVWMSDDDLIAIGPQQYAEFVVPEYSKIFETFRGGLIHFCGDGSHQMENLLRIKNLRVVNNSPMYNFAALRKIAMMADNRVALHIQDIAPYDVEDNYRGVFEALGDLKGKMITTFVCDNVSMAKGGGSVSEARNTVEVANRIVDFARACVDRKLRGVA
jgi:hypothetical protein